MTQVAKLILSRQGRVNVALGNSTTPENVLRALDLELAELGYVASYKLRSRLASLGTQELARQLEWIRQTLAEQTGAAYRHQPLFRSFPNGIPDNTYDLWVKKVVNHFFQAEDMPCLFCNHVGSTHVLQPCRHVVCEECFDGASYSACPICEHHVDTSSPFFKPSPIVAPSVRERVTFKLLDLGTGDEAERLFESLCARTQALSKDDREALQVIAKETGVELLARLPEVIPVKENIAIIFGELLKVGDADEVFAAAPPYVKTATDLLRLIAAFSGADVGLQGEPYDRYTMTKTAERISAQRGEERREQSLSRMFGDDLERDDDGEDDDIDYDYREVRHEPSKIRSPRTVRRFKVAKMGKALRRAILGHLNGMPLDRLAEDMLRHQSYWVWVGKFLHPFEYADRFPRATLAFARLRETEVGDDKVGRVIARVAREQGVSISDDKLVQLKTFYGRLEEAASRGDGIAFAGIAKERPGELARRLDHALRLVVAARQSHEPVVEAFCEHVGAMSTPVLITLLSLLPTRTVKSPVRLYFPKGKDSTGVFAEDKRPALPEHVVAPLLSAIQAQLLTRFGEQKRFASAVIDRELEEVVAPFNERTASKGTSLPRGSRMSILEGKGDIFRLFMHWCEPALAEKKDSDDDWSYGSDTTTDLDLSIGFFDADWKYIGVCSYYQHQFSAVDQHDGRFGRYPDRWQDENSAEYLTRFERPMPKDIIARSAGDLRDAPHPDGATEFVDLHIDRARAAGIRYAVMVVNKFDGLPFNKLERAYAGLMQRRDDQGAHFDPHTVAFKFDLDGDKGAFMPMVVDFEERKLHWIDVYGKGQNAFNNVESSSENIAKVCPALMTYFASGARASVYDLGLLHAASRSDNVFVRQNGGVLRFTRRPTETVAAFHRRIVFGIADEQLAALPRFDGNTFAALFHGDAELSGEGNSVYAVFREQLTDVISASDLLSE